MGDRGGKFGNKRDRFVDKFQELRKAHSVMWRCVKNVWRYVG